MNKEKMISLKNTVEDDGIYIVLIGENKELEEYFNDIGNIMI